MSYDKSGKEIIFIGVTKSGYLILKLVGFNSTLLGQLKKISNP